jgi:hypothetical protein
MESVAKIKLNHFLNLLPTYGYSAEKLIFYDSIIHQVAKLRALSFKIWFLFFFWCKISIPKNQS